MRFARLLLTFVTAPRLLFAAEPVRFSEHLLVDRLGYVFGVAAADLDGILDPERGHYVQESAAGMEVEVLLFFYGR